MAYQTSVPASTQGIINALIAFLVSDGGFTLSTAWSFNGDATTPDTTSSGTPYSAQALSRGGEFVTFCWKTSAPDRVWLNTSTSINNALKLYTQDGAAELSFQLPIGTTAIRYHLFSDGDATHCVVEKQTGVFMHINVGTITKYGAFTGGIFVTGSAWFSASSNWDSSSHTRPFDGRQTGIAPGHIRATYAGRAIAWFARTNNNLTTNVAFGLPLWNLSYPLNRSPNAYNGRALLVPIEVTIGLENNTQQPTYHKPVGRVNNAAYINITNLNPGDEILTDWMVFPLSAKNAGGAGPGFVNSLNYGMAYRK
jgi:hypothetical protein